MKIKLFLDGKANPPSEEWATVRSFDEAKEYISANGVPRMISLGFDLGVDENEKPLPNGNDFVKWLIEADASGEAVIPSGFIFRVHAEDPVRASGMTAILRGYLDFKYDNYNA